MFLFFRKWMQVFLAFLFGLLVCVPITAHHKSLYM